jgi:hypothetical protein
MVLSGVVLLLVLAALVNTWRRASFPGVAYGGVSLSNRRLRWVWFIVLIGALGLGVGEDLIVTQTDAREDLPTLEGSPRLRTVSVTLPLPFYRYERERTYGDGVLIEEQVVEGLLIPWPLLYALFAFWILVVRWNPENRWAIRILQGRKGRFVDPVE